MDITTNNKRSDESLKITARKRLMNMLSDVNGDNPLLFTALICDHATLHLVSSSLESSDLVANRVAVVDRLDKIREPLMNMDAIYFITPSEENFVKLLEDFPNLDFYKPKYRKHHIFLNQSCPDSLMRILTDRRDVVKRIATFIELNLNFLARDDRAFHFGGDPVTMLRVFPKRDDRLLRQYSAKLVSLFSSMGDLPLIRFQKESVDNWTAKLAQQFHTDIQEHWDSLQSLGKQPRQCKSTFLILDRSVDTCAPFLHDFGYEALSFDLIGGYSEPDRPINIPNETFTYDTSTTDGVALHKVCQLTDELWQSLRHRSAMAAKESIKTQLLDLKQNNEIAVYIRKEKAGEKQEATARILRQLPAYQEKVGRYGTHLHLCDTVLKMVQDMDLKMVGALEQDLACAISVSGRPINSQSVMIQLAQCLLSKTLSQEVKARLFVLYCFSMNGVTQEHRDKMMTTAGLDMVNRKVCEILFTLGFLDAESSKASAIHTPKTPMEEQANYRDAMLQESELKQTPVRMFNRDLFRYVPRVKMLVDKVCRDALDSSNFPFVGRAGAADIDISSRKMNVSSRPRIYVFMIGGMTYSETRTAIEISARYNVDVFVGTDGFFNPSSLWRKGPRSGVKAARTSGGPGGNGGSNGGGGGEPGSSGSGNGGGGENGMNGGGGGGPGQGRGSGGGSGSGSQNLNGPSQRASGGPSQNAESAGGQRKSNSDHHNTGKKSSTRRSG